MIEFKKVTKKFGQTVALQDLSFTIKKGEFVFLVGPSGAGKTTVLKLLLRQLLPTSGKIVVDGQEITRLPRKKIFLLRRNIGAVFQDYKILKDQTVKENIVLPLLFQNFSPEEIESRFQKIIKLVGLKGKEALFPAQLAGGELQRVVIARAAIASPPIIFADEPTGNLDPETAWQITRLLKKLNRQGTTVVMATHNVDIVDSLRERVIRLEKGRLIKDTPKGSYRSEK